MRQNISKHISHRFQLCPLASETKRVFGFLGSPRDISNVRRLEYRRQRGRRLWGTFRVRYFGHGFRSLELQDFGDIDIV